MTSFPQDAFNSGEICEEALSRADIAQAQKIVRLGRDGFYMVHGGWRRRKGTWKVAKPKSGTSDIMLVPFTRVAGQSVMLELGVSGGAGYGRIYGLDRARVGTVEFATPFTQDELNGGLSFLQTGDDLIIYRRNNKQPYVIHRTDTTTWTCSAYGLKYSPLRTEYTGDGPTLTPGSANATLSSGLFTADDVGGMIRFKGPLGYSSADGWRSDWDPYVREDCYYAGNYYRSGDDAGIHTGYNPPVHTSGTRRDGSDNGGPYGVSWTYLHDGGTWGVITGFVSATQVTVAWQGALATGYMSDSTTANAGTGIATGYWARGAYNGALGWPGMAPCITQERIVTGGTIADPDMLDMTRTNGWDSTQADYKPGMSSGLVVADDAIRARIGGNGAQLMWAAERDGLVVASSRHLYSVQGAGPDNTLKPTDGVLVREIPGEGSSTVLPAKTPKSILYAPLARRSVYEIINNAGDLTANEISLLFAHLSGRGVAQILFMHAPWHMIVLRLDDGGVAFVTYNRDQNVLAAATQNFDGRVMSLAVVDGPTGEDQLWLAIERDNGVFIEVMAGFYESQFLDCASFYSGSPISTVAGLDDYEGLTVQALADGQWHPDLVVASGEVTLLASESASSIVVGLAVPWRLEVMPLGRSQESWADLRSKPLRVKITARATYYLFGTTDGDVGGGAGDSRPEPVVHKDANGKWIEKRHTQRSPVMTHTDDDRRIYITGGNSPFDFVLYSLKVEASTQ